MIDKPMGPEYYDRQFEVDPKYSVHYKDSRYYKIWMRVVGKLLDCNIWAVTSIGCGTGQFENLLTDYGIGVVGIDFSQVAIDKARKTCPLGTFVCKDVKDYKFDSTPVVALEIFEHVDDLELIGKLPHGVVIVFMVPSRDAAAHVRVFENEENIRERYSAVIEIEEIENHSDRYFICVGNVK